MESTRRTTGGNSLRRLSTRAQGLATSTRHAIALAAAATGLLARMALEPVWQGRPPYITLFPAIMVSAWLGGFGPGLLTTLLTAVGAAYLWVPLLRPPPIADSSEWLGLAMFVAVGSVISVLNEMWRRGTVALAESEERLAEHDPLVEPRCRTHFRLYSGGNDRPLDPHHHPRGAMGGGG